MITSAWAKSSYTTADGSRVEVSRTQDGNIQVHDSKTPTGPLLTFPPSEWSTFRLWSQARRIHPLARDGHPACFIRSRKQRDRE